MWAMRPCAWLSLLLLTACSGGDPGPPSEPGKITPGDAAFSGATDGGVVNGPGLGDCPCAAGSYCDLATQKCKAGCLDDAGCAAGQRCDRSAHTCASAPAPEIQCATMTCSGGNVCCVNHADGASGSNCAPSCSSTQLTLACDDGADCGAGQLCCGSLAVGGTSCTASCVIDTSSAAGHVVLCSSSADCASAVGTGNVPFTACCDNPMFGVKLCANKC